MLLAQAETSTNEHSEAMDQRGHRGRHGRAVVAEQW